MSTTDLRDPAAAQRLVDVPLTTYGRVDFVVANAGSGKTGDFLRLSDADGEEGFGLKLFGHMRLVRAAWPHLSSAQGSVILLAGRAGRTWVLGRRNHDRPVRSYSLLAALAVPRRRTA